MLREIASNSYNLPPILHDSDEHEQTQVDVNQSMRDLVIKYMTIADETSPTFGDFGSEDQAIMTRSNSEPVVSYHGYLKQESSQVYEKLNQALKPFNRYALFRENVGNASNPHRIDIIDGLLPDAPPRRSWWNLGLFILTVLAVFFTGAQQATTELGLLEAVSDNTIASIIVIGENIWRGYPYALSIMLILIAHELGHFIMMRWHGLKATLPYFIPAPILTPFGTLGATILLDDVIKNRKVLLDIGVAGPIAGFVVSVPLVIYGLSISEIVPLSTSGYLEGNSLMYLFAKIVALGQIYPTPEQDVLLSQVAFAGWTGLLLTMMQMIPLGQLDGGYVLYALFGEKARWAFLPVMLIFVGITIITSQLVWIAFLLLLLFIGRFYAVPLDNITPLDATRKFVAGIALVIFVLTFVPMPFVPVEDSLFTQDNASIILVIGLIVLPRLLSSKLRR